MFSDLVGIDLLFIITVLVFVIYFYTTKTFNHFKKRGVKFVKPLPIFGNFKEFILGSKSFPIVINELYEKGKGEQFIGTFLNGEPILILRDPKIIQQILIKDFNSFYDRGRDIDSKVDPLLANLVNLEGQQWKSLRQKLTPAFSSGKLKCMQEQFNECGDFLLEHIKNLADNDKPGDIREIMSKFATDVIGTCAFGLRFNSLKDPESNFRKVGRDLFKPRFLTRLRTVLAAIHPKLPLLLGIKIIKKEYEDFFFDLIKDTIKYREINNIERNDFVQILINLMKQDLLTSNDVKNNSKLSNSNKDNTEEKSGSHLVLNDTLLAANTFVFFIAGFETTATTLTFCLFELSLPHNSHIQARLRNEILKTLEKHKEITDEALKELCYMESVISETLRKYPVVGTLVRNCTNTCHLTETVVMKKGEKVMIAVYGLHHDPEYYPEPGLFDPERFNEENKAKRPKGSYLPFGDGPHVCIGLRFAMMEMKVALTKILSRYEVSLNNMTPPLTWNAKRIFLTPADKIWLNFKEI